jgi:putative oxidoreductase
MPAVTTSRDWAALAGRVLLAAIFVHSGFGKITGFEGTVAAIAAAGLPLPQAGAILAILVELGGGLMLVAGYKARWAALAIAALTLVASFFFHNYWAAPPDKYMAQFLNFWKNVSMIGGLLVVYAFGPGRLSIDRA